MLEKVKPLTNEYKRKLNLAVVGFILVILADKNITNANSTIIINNSPPVLITFITIFGFTETKYPVKNVTNKPINIHPNVLTII